MTLSKTQMLTSCHKPMRKKRSKTRQLLLPPHPPTNQTLTHQPNTYPPSQHLLTKPTLTHQANTYLPTQQPKTYPIPNNYPTAQHLHNNTYTTNQHVFSRLTLTPTEPNTYPSTQHLPTTACRATSNQTFIPSMRRKQSIIT